CQNHKSTISPNRPPAAARHLSMPADGSDMTPNTPRFSIGIPVFNRERYVAETLRSVLAQEGDDFEIIVVDDGSTDRSMEIVEGFADPRISIVRNGHAGGAAARNAGIARARGEFVVWMDSDDIQAPGALHELRRTMAA